MADPWVRKVVIGDSRRMPDGCCAIYALCESDGRPRYVGKTIFYIHIRHKEHIRKARAGSGLPVHRWMRKQERLGNGFAIHLLEFVPSELSWQDRERHWIAKTREEQPDCLNLCDGGEGIQGHKFSVEHRQRISQRLKKGADIACSECGSTFWRKPKDMLWGNLFCSRGCYQKWQSGKSKPVSAECQRAGAAASRAKKLSLTHCFYGHEFTGSNTYINPKGARVCKECRKRNTRNFRAAKPQTIQPSQEALDL